MSYPGRLMMSRDGDKFTFYDRTRKKRKRGYRVTVSHSGKGYKSLNPKLPATGWELTTNASGYYDDAVVIVKSIHDKKRFTASTRKEARCYAKAVSMLTRGYVYAVRLGTRGKPSFMYYAGKEVALRKRPRRRRSK